MHILGNVAVAAFLALSVSAPSPWLPNPVLTPGAINPAITQANINQTICVSGWTTKVRPPASYTNKLKKQQMAQYGYGNINPHLLEEDHRVPLEVGGNPTDPHNLWPQLWKGQFGAHAKDRLENLIHRRVCAGRMTLREGQAVFLGDWTIAYRKFFMAPAS